MLGTLLANLPGIAYRCANDRDWTMEFISEGVLELTGRPATDFIGNQAVSYNDVIHPDDRAMVWDTIQAAVGRAEPYQITYRIVTASDQTRWVWEQGRGVFDGDALVALEGFITDVTDRVHAETVLRDTKDRLQDLVESMAEGVAELDPDGVHIDVNPAFAAMTGFSRDELLGVGPPHPYWPPEAMAEINEAFESAMTGRAREFDLTFMRKGGERFPVVVCPFIIRDENGATVSVSATVRDVSEERRADAALRASESRLNEAERIAGMGSWEYDVATGIETWSENTYRVLGVDRDSPIALDDAHSLEPIIHPDDVQLFRDTFTGALDGSRDYAFDYRIVRGDGEPRTVRAKADVVRDDAGKPVRMIGTVRDITEQCASEAAIRALAEESRQLADAGVALIGCQEPEEVVGTLRDYFTEAVPEAVILITSSTDDGMHLFVSAVSGMDSSRLAHAADLLGFSIVGKPFVIGEDERDRVFTRALARIPGGFCEFVLDEIPQPVAKVVEKAFRFHDAYVIGITDGDSTFGNVSILTMKPDVPIPRHAIESVANVAFLTLARMRAGRVLAESEERYRVLTESMADVVWTLDPETMRFLYVSPSVTRLRGYTPEEVMSEPMDAALTPESARAVREIMGKRREDRLAGKIGVDTFFTGEVEQPCKDGSTVWTEVVTNYHLNPESGRVEVRGVTRDISERKVAEAQIRASQDKFRYIFDHSNVPKSITQPSGEVDVNDAFLDALGYTREELAQRSTWRQLTHPDDMALTEEMVAALVTGERNAVRFEKRFIRKDGSVMWADMSSALRRRDDGAPDYIMTTVMDITDRKAIEHELLESRRNLEAIVEERTAKLAGAFTELQRANDELREATAAKSAFLASMSHELRTPLNSIIGFSGILTQGLAGPLSDEQRTQIEMVNRSGRHLLSLIDDVLDLAKVEAGKADVLIDTVDPEVIVGEVATAVRPLADDKGLSLDAEVCGFEGTIRSDAGKLRQILFNLVGNAVKFTDAGSVKLGVHCEGDGMCAFSVTDTGPGIAAADIPRIFEPFTQLESPRTAKPQGTGLGLRISREYAHLLGGELTVESEVGAGSTFMLRIPIEPAAADSGE